MDAEDWGGGIGPETQGQTDTQTDRWTCSYTTRSLGPRELLARRGHQPGQLSGFVRALERPPPPAPAGAPPATARTRAWTRPPGSREGSKVAAAVRSVALKGSPGGHVPLGPPPSLGCWCPGPLPACSIKGGRQRPCLVGRPLGPSGTCRIRDGRSRRPQVPLALARGCQVDTRSPRPAPRGWGRGLHGAALIGCGVKGEGLRIQEPPRCPDTSASAQLWDLSPDRHPPHAANSRLRPCLCFCGAPAHAPVPLHARLPGRALLRLCGQLWGPGHLPCRRTWGQMGLTSLSAQCMECGVCRCAMYRVHRYVRGMGVGAHKMCGCGV